MNKHTDYYTSNEGSEYIYMLEIKMQVELLINENIKNTSIASEWYLPGFIKERERNHSYTLFSELYLSL